MESALSLSEIGALRESATTACSLLKVLANEDRLLILCQLVQGEKNVGELEKLVGITQPSLSQQLSILREEGMVDTRREGKYIFYRIANFEAIQLMQTLSKLYCGKLMANMGQSPG